MQLDQITTAIRLRSAWEAVDLGSTLVQAQWRGIYPAWTLLLFSLAILLLLVTPKDYVPFLSLGIWWLKPLYDRVLLHIVSRQLFQESPSMADVFNALPQLVWHTGLMGALTWRRFSLSRGFNLPIWQLEQLRGEARQARQKLLLQQSHSYALWLTIACLHLEYVVVFGLYALIVLLDPTGYALEFLRSFFLDGFDETVLYWGGLLSFIIYVVAVWLIEPLYVTTSFTLYLNRRTHLEAWDIELAFRSLGERLRGLAQRGMPLLLVMTLGLSLLPSPPAFAAESEEEALATERQPSYASKPTIEAIMQLDSFTQVRSVKRWMLRDTETEEQDFSIWTEEIQHLTANGLKAVLWFAVVALVVIAVAYHRRLLALLKPAPKKSPPPQPPDTLFGMDIRPESLPDDLATTCRRLWEQGQAREALGLLYRGALMHLTRHDVIPVQDSHTEGDILRLAGKFMGEARLAWLTATTHAWQEIAYAHRRPSDTQVMPLFESWVVFSQNKATTGANL